MERLASRLAHAFRALRHRPFRVYWIGQWLSVNGTWMQTTAQAWLVYRLTDSPLVLGILSAVRFGPALVGSPIAGVLTDRLPRRLVVLTTQSLSLVQATLLAALTLSGAIRVWQVLLLALAQGIVDTLDTPARQTLQVDIVGVEDLQSAVSLNASAFNAARMVGPALAGVMVAAWGEGVCFAVNAVSYLAVLVALLTIRPQPAAARRAGSMWGELSEGVRYAWNNVEVRTMLGGIAVTSLFGLSYTTLLPVFARDVLHGGVRGFGVLMASGGLGAVVGALGAAARRSGRHMGGIMAAGQGALGLGLVALAFTGSLPVASVWMVVIGLGVAIQLSTTNGFLQVTAPAHMRGRVVSLYIWLFSGLAPVGGFAAGWIAEHVGAPWTAAGAGVACGLAAALTCCEMPLLRRAFARPCRSAGEGR
ncbi:MAG: MFS transporter [Thermoanaerobaculaceae bacterium]|nr:MFS transporter [Thermoanaerobaculaceae bacterium]TAM53303.1 MAG: MFS transporter [Acidobacteriota bacterium]